MTHLFVGGLHRSGTTVMHDCLAEHHGIVSFSGTGVPQDEGQFLQSVYPHVNHLGGAGTFGFNPRAHLTESDCDDEAASTLAAEWAAHWGASAGVYLEKTPQNLVMARFLQAAFPKSVFVFVTRHPLISALATLKWSNSSVMALLEHWLHCHRILRNDLSDLDRFLIIRYEDFVCDPDAYLTEVLGLVDLAPSPRTTAVAPTASDRYARRLLGAIELETRQGRVGGDGLWPDRAYRRRRRFARSIERRVVQSRLVFGDDSFVGLLHRELPAIRHAYSDAVQEFGYRLFDPLAPVSPAAGHRGFATPRSS